MVDVLQNRRLADIWSRHMEAVSNSTAAGEGHFQQSSDLLTERGVKQAEVLGKYLADHNVTFGLQRILSSTDTRALQTAEIVDRYLRLGIIPSELLVERKNSPEVEGRAHGDQEAKDIKREIDRHTGTERIIRGGETRYGIYARVDEAFNWRMSLSENRVLWMTHGGFLKMGLYRAMMEGRDWDFDLWQRHHHLEGNLGNGSIVGLKRESNNNYWERTNPTDDCYLTGIIRFPPVNN